MQVQKGKGGSYHTSDFPSDGRVPKGSRGHELINETIKINKIILVLRASKGSEK